jgi:nucleoside-diphosphate-sugar epimerase
VPAPVARAVAATSEAAWRLLQLSGRPPLTRLAVWVSGLETTIDITRAREELGYAPVKTIDQGLEELGRW